MALIIHRATVLSPSPALDITQPFALASSLRHLVARCVYPGRSGRSSRPAHDRLVCNQPMIGLFATSAHSVFPLYMSPLLCWLHMYCDMAKCCHLRVPVSESTDVWGPWFALLIAPQLQPLSLSLTLFTLSFLTCSVPLHNITIHYN